MHAPCTQRVCSTTTRTRARLLMDSSRSMLSVCIVRTDLSCVRGYEFWLASQAKLRNQARRPFLTLANRHWSCSQSRVDTCGSQDIILYGLPWGFPHWLAGVQQHTRLQPPQRIPSVSGWCVTQCEKSLTSCICACADKNAPNPLEPANANKTAHYIANWVCTPFEREFRAHASVEMHA